MGDFEPVTVDYGGGPVLEYPYCDVCGRVLLTVTGTGTANNPVIVGLPITAVNATGVQTVGAGMISAAGGNFGCIPYLSSTTAVSFIDTTAAVGVVQGQTGAAFGVGLVNTNTVQYTVIYEAA